MCIWNLYHIFSGGTSNPSWSAVVPWRVAHHGYSLMWSQWSGWGTTARLEMYKVTLYRYIHRQHVCIYIYINIYTDCYVMEMFIQNDFHENFHDYCEIVFWLRRTQVWPNDLQFLGRWNPPKLGICYPEQVSLGFQVLYAYDYMYTYFWYLVYI